MSKQWSQDETQQTDHTAFVGFPHQNICLQVEEVSNSYGGQSSLQGIYVDVRHCLNLEWVCREPNILNARKRTSGPTENQQQLK